MTVIIVQQDKCVLKTSELQEQCANYIAKA